MTEQPKSLDQEARELLGKHCCDYKYVSTVRAIAAMSEVLARLRQAEAERDAVREGAAAIAIAFGFHPLFTI